MHQAGIVHLDLKLTNVMIGTDNKLKICDFGLAESSSEVVTIKTGT